MAYNISATCGIGRIVSRRRVPQRAIRQARDYRGLGYADIRITDLDTGEVYDASTLAAKLQARANENGSAP